MLASSSFMSININLAISRTVKQLLQAVCLILLWSFMVTASAKNWLDEPDGRWSIVNDNVMGGLSQSKAFWNQDETSIRFQGALSLDNNGGFASIRSAVKPGFFANANRICVEIKGDGRDYQFRLRDSLRFDGPAYVVELTTQSGVWEKFCFTEKGFKPQFRGRKVAAMPDIKFSDIKQIGFLLADKKLKPFRLDIRAVYGDRGI
jgi:hypothetical protein